MENAIKVKVQYYEYCTYSESGSGRWDDWSEEYDSGIESVTFDDGESSYNSDVFLLPEGSTEAHVVYIIYNTGDSFGHANGKIDVIHCCASREDAEKLGEMISDNQDQYTFKFKDDFGRDISLDNAGAGYFECITGIYVETFVLGHAKKSFLN